MCTCVRGKVDEGGECVHGKREGERVCVGEKRRGQEVIRGRMDMCAWDRKGG